MNSQKFDSLADNSHQHVMDNNKINNVMDNLLAKLSTEEDQLSNISSHITSLRRSPMQLRIISNQNCCYLTSLFIAF